MSTIQISAAGVISALEGVVVATKIPTAQQPVFEWLNTKCDVSWTMDEWRNAGRQQLQTPGAQEILTISLAIAVLREMSRAKLAVREDTLEPIWSMIRDTVKSPGDSGMQFSAIRSSQGFMAIPLCSLIKDGRIQELWRFHYWLDDGQRGREETKTHAHQCYAQSWVLAGVSHNITMDVKKVDSAQDATNAIYTPVWTDNNNNKGRDYKTHLLSSTIANTGSYVTAREVEHRTYTRDQSYDVPAGAYHQSDVKGDQKHATLFVFDAAQGYVHDAPILGPVDGDEYTEMRDSAGITAVQLVEAADDLRHAV